MKYGPSSKLHALRLGKRGHLVYVIECAACRTINRLWLWSWKGHGFAKCSSCGACISADPPYLTADTREELASKN